MTSLLGKRSIFWELQDIAKANPKILKPGAFFDWMCQNYIAAITVGARRFTDQDYRSRSLWRMLYEILENPGVINRRAHISLYRGVPMSMGNPTFDAVVGVGKQQLSQMQVRSDLRAIESANEKVRRFVNKRIAHFANPRDIRKFPTFNELDEALDKIDKILCKYNLLLRASGMTSAYAERQYDWMEVLKEPWIIIKDDFEGSEA